MPDWISKLGRRARRARERAQRWWAEGRRQGTRQARARRHLRQLRYDLEDVHRKLKDYPDSNQLEAQRKHLLNAIARTQVRRDNRKHKRHVARQKAKFLVKRSTIYRRRYVKAKRKWDKDHKGEYESWMLNGHSGNIDPDLKPVIAFLVGAMGQTITDTYDYSGHTPSSLHYPRNDPTPPQQGRAVDSAGPDMAGVQQKCRDKFGAGKFLELFGPQSWYVKNGSVYSTGGGAFPGHSDHQHSGVA